MADQPAHLTMIECDVTAGTTGQQAKAQFAQCQCYKSYPIAVPMDAQLPSHFMVYQIEGQNHYHLQCVDCNMSYCPTGTCTLPNPATS